MNLNKEELAELNRLLANRNLDIPPRRREVTPNGTNYKWLQQNIWIRNKGKMPRRLCEMLRIDRYVSIDEYARSESPKKTIA